MYSICLKNLRCLGIILLLLFAAIEGLANNVRIKGDVRVLARNITNEVNKPNIATFSFTVEWDNSWRDQFNYDAVYVFLKHKVRGNDEPWYQVYIQDQGNTLSSSDYAMEMKNNTGVANHNEGFFLYRKNNGTGTASVEVTLKWDIQSTDRPASLRISDFQEGKVLLSAMGIEMVYIPRGAFRIGDTYSKNHFRNNYLGMPEKYDIVPYADEFFTSSVKGSPLYADPALAANQVNDISTDLNPVTGFPTNAWYGDREGEDERGEVGYQYWACNFKTPRRVKYIAIESVPGYVPKKWKLQGQTRSEDFTWVDIAEGTDTDWETSLVRVYPPVRVIPVNQAGTYYYNYRIYMNQKDMPGGMSGNPPLIKKIAMAEADLEGIVDNSVLIHDPVTTLGTWMGLAADDGDEWNGKTDVDYPNGYSAFYTMKYEVSQEQYVAFLNKLTAAQQRSRTIGAELEKLNEGDYVFGNKRTEPSCRNGIILLKHSQNGEPAVFEAKKEPGKTDGTLACNYLSPADMLAYADWSGLRPMTEMEYEKMCRPFYPTETGRGDYPWGSTSRHPVTALERPATRFEVPTEGAANVNFGKNIEGPVRAGAFLAKSSSREETGANFWGTMETAGNLAEIYYNVNKEGRLFRGLCLSLHGDGYLADDGHSDIGEIYWPVHHNAFILKGGHWADTDPKLLAVSDRSRNQNYYKDMDISRRDSTVTFRLAQTAPQHTLNTYLTLQNGVSTENISGGVKAADTVCHGNVYTIYGSLPEEMKGKLYSVVWYKSENKGASWEPVEGVGDQSLTVSRLWNINTNEDVIVEYWFKKEIYGALADAKSDTVILRVLNSNTYLNRNLDTLDVYDHSTGVRVNVSMKAEFSWLFDRKDQDISYDVLPKNLQKSEVGFPLYHSLKGEQTYYIIRSRFMKHCITNDTVWVTRKPEPSARLSDASDWKCGDFMIDARDGKRYRTVAVGSQCWMADNLNYNVMGSRCYEEKASNCDVYGRLYNWEQAVGEWNVDKIQGACPKGWHVPNINEWASFNTVYDQGKDWRSQQNLWQEDVAQPHVYAYENLATNKSRFSALPGGGYFFSYSTNAAQGSAQLKRTTNYYDLGQRAWWWSSTGIYGSYVAGNTTENAKAMIPMYATVDYKNDAGVINTAGSNASIFYGPIQYLGNASAVSSDTKYYATVALTKNFYFSVRCVKD